jgi:hypothetical protein
MEDSVRDGKFTTFGPTHSDVNCEVCRDKVETKNAKFTTVLSYIHAYVTIIVVYRLDRKCVYR